ncbi:hypothetical protein [Piscirickettsia salmonis]|uniref:Uncharacterized protein n=2 Tax=Piscirickettsia salmonis TaxID=1238 RepID=A0A9Q6LQ77_PISSA|nr:hypothetical protein [Piscirickettsia salmonis]ALA26249.1 hypothetical protein KW89_2787 [Piscirickettsia salmonis]QGN76119.1 hypothetical protein Psal001_00293 [Piscirickettsia salmonis]QGN79682.1 hypothetical protein Psal002_00291 [Piscirickettsia salmonis]QGN83271.1 hypothetical protein Psal003_00290 [Piscirickettsia salmonis]QGN86785.1 hypothetical protein Psal004_00290 [Piscirickettsia salmonis]
MSYHPYLQLMGVSQWQPRMLLPGAKAPIAVPIAPALVDGVSEEAKQAVDQCSEVIDQLVLLVPQRSWQKPAVRLFLEQLISAVPYIRYEIEGSPYLSPLESQSQSSSYWGLGVLQTDVVENLPEAERFIASGTLKKQLWRKLWQWKKTKQG